MREIGRTEGAIASEERIIKKEKEILRSSDQTVAITEVEGLAGEVERELHTADSETDLEKLKSILNRVRGLISGFVARHKKMNQSKIPLIQKKKL